jgi:hypothetical protein
VRRASTVTPTWTDEDGPDPRDAYSAIDRAFAEGWNDPKMDDYDGRDEPLAGHTLRMPLQHPGD